MHPATRITEKTGGYEEVVFAPALSVFVSAHAGAGKTQWLTGRVLGLLLSGADPAKILCLTFTNAAAAQMSDRILSELGAWVMSDEAALKKKITDVLGRAPDAATLARARSLFASVLEAPEGIRIQTIHGFCQSLLARFPIEAGISPHFTVMDDRGSQEMLWEARLSLFDQARSNQPLAEAIGLLVRHGSDGGLQKLFEQIIKQKNRFEELLSLPGGAAAAAEALHEAFGSSPGDTPESLVKKYFTYDEIMHSALKRIAALLANGKKVTDRNRGRGMHDWLTGANRDNAAIEAYVRLFLSKSQDYAKLDKLCTKDALTDAVFVEQLLQEQERVARFHDARQSLLMARLSGAVLCVAEAFLAAYDHQKTVHARMDYDDLIASARALLRRPGISPWVLYKLDGGIDHVLVDEAQDTSPAQWDIIRALKEDFLSGAGSGGDERSLSFVGDEKQSIFSFQGAVPGQLAAMHAYFHRRMEDAGRPVMNKRLDKSFRSVPQVLAAVDAVFALPQAGAGVISGSDALKHVPHRAGENGLVELWPLLEADEEGAASAHLQLVRLIADTIKRWLKDGLWLESRNRAINPGDIMILLRARGTFADALVRALKRRKVPVAGIDRMYLSENLAVQDLIALGQFLLLPEDDLNLAALLKSPVGNVSEETLFALAHGRGGTSLWERLARSDACKEIYDLLYGLRGKADYLPPYELYAHALDTLGLRRRMLGRMGGEYADAMDEFLAQALIYQQENAASLQGFLHWLTRSESEIKRDMEQSVRAVRVMTVHGAKGLQAPVVILPDTVSQPELKEALLWHEGLPLWIPAAEKSNALGRALREASRQEMLDEYRRLLYVAMTRAEDHLYLCGAAGKKSREAAGWHALVKEALQPIAAPCDTPAGEGLRLGESLYHPERSEGSFTLQRQRSFVAGAPQDDNRFSFLTNPAPPEKSPPAPLAPSRPASPPPPASPLKPDIYARGTFIHTLLQHLPEVPEKDRPALALRLSSACRLPEEQRRQGIQEALALMAHPDFKEVFSMDALAEAPVTGVVRQGEKEFVISGQVDRLLVGARDVWIVDYKTSREPPRDIKDIPAAYLRQMAAYRLLLKRIYPEKAVRCALLWTAAPRMDVLDESLLETYI